MINNLPVDVCMRNLRRKAEQGKKTGSNSNTRFPQASCFEKTRHVCKKYGGGCMKLKYQRYEKTGQENGFRSAKKGPKKLVSSDCAKILEKESSN
jgi:hypothetical protein